MKTLQRLTPFVFCVSAFVSPAAAQEDWSTEELPPVSRSAGLPLTAQRLHGNEYITARCQPFINEEFACRDDPENHGLATLVPISSFARASTVEALGADVAALTRIQTLDRTDIRQGVAAAVAIGNAPFPSAPGRTSYDFNLATFRGEEALGGSIKHRLNTSQPMAISIGVSTVGNRNTAARVGISGEF